MQIKKRNPDKILFSESQINALGYEYLSNGMVKEAIEVFKFNVEVYPSSSNVYDSLGEGYMVDGQYEQAIKFYEKSIELNPDNQSAERLMKKVKSKCN